MNRASSYIASAVALSLAGSLLYAQDAAKVSQSIEARAARYSEIAKQIWDFAEVGYQETRSSKLLQSELATNGFRIEAGVAGMPTSFVAHAGSGRPVIAILAEFDALPGITQDASPVRSPVATKDAGHACGHHLFGTGSIAAAIAVKDWLAQTKTSGTIRVYGTPAEEGGAGKVYMVRAGLFKDVDAVLHWHASDRYDASPGKTLPRPVHTHAAAQARQPELPDPCGPFAGRCGRWT